MTFQFLFFYWFSWRKQNSTDFKLSGQKFRKEFSFSQFFLSKYEFLKFFDVCSVLRPVSSLIEFLKDVFYIVTLHSWLKIVSKRPLDHVGVICTNNKIIFTIGRSWVRISSLPILVSKGMTGSMIPLSNSGTFNKENLITFG